MAHVPLLPWILHETSRLDHHFTNLTRQTSLIHANSAYFEKKNADKFLKAIDIDDGDADIVVHLAEVIKLQLEQEFNKSIGINEGI